MLQSKTEGERVTVQKGNLVFTKWHDKRDVSILSSNCDPLDPPEVRTRRAREGEVVHTEKPVYIAMYNQFMGGVDHANQLHSYYSTCPPCRKWYRYTFWFIFKVVLGNVFALHKAYVHEQG